MATDTKDRKAVVEDLEHFIGQAVNQALRSISSDPNAAMALMAAAETAERLRTTLSNKMV